MSPSKIATTEWQAGVQDQKMSVRQAAVGTNAYNPRSGTFHMLATLSSDFEEIYGTGMLKSRDEANDTASSHGGGADTDCVSSNGSCSGESEDQLHASAKDKILPAKLRTFGTDKREKIRSKNERKHQRQKERRAQELRDKCYSYLMSWKLEGLSQRLVSMGFPHEQASMALIVNNGHVEQAVAWLLEEGQVHDTRSLNGNLKIDISHELGQLIEIERKYKFLRPNIERAVVSYEGDLEKALDSLRTCNVSAITKGEFKEGSRIADVELPASLPVLIDGPIASQPRSNAVMPRKVGVGAPFSEGKQIAAPKDGQSKTSTQQLPSKTSTQIQLLNLQSFVTGVGRKATSRSVSLKAAPPLESSFTPVSCAETGLVFGFGAPDPGLLFANSIKDHFRKAAPAEEPAHKGQARLLLQSNSHSAAASKNNPTMSPLISPSSWTRQGLMEAGSQSSVLHVQDSARKKGLASIRHSCDGSEMGPGDLPDPGSSLSAIQDQSQGSLWNGVGRGLPYDIVSASLSLPEMQSRRASGSSYGLFTGWNGGVVTQSATDWSTCSIRNFDYAKIDWSMNATQSTTQQQSLNHPNFAMPQMKGGYPCNYEEGRRFQTGGRAGGFSTDLTWSGPPGAGMHNQLPADFQNPSSHEWTSPFAGKALFNFPQTVSLPFL